VQRIRKYIVTLLAKYGYMSAQMPSYHGSYETVVPKAVQEKIAHK